MGPRSGSSSAPRVSRDWPAVGAQSVSSALLLCRVRAPQFDAARPRVGFASTSPTTRPHRADGRVPGGRLGGRRTHGVGDREEIGGEER